MTIGPITTVASAISPDRNASQIPEHGARRSVDQTEVRATLTSNIASLSSLVAQAMQTPATQHQRVDILRAAISSGSYAINAGDIATSILRELG